MENEKIKVGVLGVGVLGRHHARLYAQSPNAEVVGIFDVQKAAAESVGAEFGLKVWEDWEKLAENCDALSVAVPANYHAQATLPLLEMGKHVLVEKPIAASVPEAEKMVETAKKHNVVFGVGHVERFNPAFIAAEPYLKAPKFIEAHRLAFFNPRGTDVPVVLDLMVHDLDILLSVVDAPVARVSACGVAVVSPTPDITNARIEFENGTVANLTASRLSLKNMRKMRFFQEDAYVSVDFLDHKTEIVRIQDPGEATPAYSMTMDLADGQTRQITMERPEVHPLNAIQTELECFCDSILHNTTPVVTIHDGVRVLNLAYDILKAAADYQAGFGI